MSPVKRPLALLGVVLVVLVLRGFLPLDQLLFRRGRGVVDRGPVEGEAERAADRPRAGLQRGDDRVPERLAVLAGLVEGAPRVRVLVPPHPAMNRATAPGFDRWMKSWANPA